MLAQAREGNTGMELGHTLAPSRRWQEHCIKTLQQDSRAVRHGEDVGVELWVWMPEVIRDESHDFQPQCVRTMPLTPPFMPKSRRLLSKENLTKCHISAHHSSVRSPSGGRWAEQHPCPQHGRHSPPGRWEMTQFTSAIQHRNLSCKRDLDSRSLPSPCDSCRNPVIPVESGGIQWNIIWQAVLPNCHSGDNKFRRNWAIPELRPEWSPELTGTESGGMKLNLFKYVLLY